MSAPDLLHGHPQRPESRRPQVSNRSPWTLESAQGQDQDCSELAAWASRSSPFLWGSLSTATPQPMGSARPVTGQLAPAWNSGVCALTG